jgi:hypothetical protein
LLADGGLWVQAMMVWIVMVTVILDALAGTVTLAAGRTMIWAAVAGGMVGGMTARTVDGVVARQGAMATGMKVRSRAKKTMRELVVVGPPYPLT